MTFKNLKPLQIYLIGTLTGLLSGVIIRPLSPTLHTIVVIVSIGICLYGIVKYFRSR